MRTGSTAAGAFTHAVSSVSTSSSTTDSARCRQSTRTVPPVGDPCSSIPTAAVAGRSAASASSISIPKDALLDIVSLLTVYSTPWYTNAASPRLPSWTVAATSVPPMAGPAAYPHSSTSVVCSTR